MAQLPTESQGRKCPEQRPRVQREPPSPAALRRLCVGLGAPLEAQGRGLRLWEGFLALPTPTRAARIFLVSQNCAVALRVV